MSNELTTERDVLKKSLRKIVEIWNMNNGVDGFAEFLCWNNNGKKATSPFFKNPDEVTRAILAQTNDEDEELHDYWTNDEWAIEQYRNWKAGLEVVIANSDSEMHIVDWLLMKQR
tara:strand:+ start:281 stop:625 length:345 start_codon:yes stop_codon:yes gene_type:complete